MLSRLKKYCYKTYEKINHLTDKARESKAARWVIGVMFGLAAAADIQSGMSLLGSAKWVTYVTYAGYSVFFIMGTFIAIRTINVGVTEVRKVISNQDRLWVRIFGIRNNQVELQHVNALRNELGAQQEQFNNNMLRCVTEISLLVTPSESVINHLESLKWSLLRMKLQQCKLTGEEEEKAAGAPKAEGVTEQKNTEQVKRTDSKGREVCIEMTTWMERLYQDAPLAHHPAAIFTRPTSSPPSDPLRLMLYNRNQASDGEVENPPRCESAISESATSALGRSSGMKK